MAVYLTLPRARGSLSSNASVYKWGTVSEVLSLAFGALP
jgi:hypothetical protein